MDLLYLLDDRFMQYYSTKGHVADISFKEAVLKGLPDDNGLFMPKKIPSLKKDFFERLSEMTFHDIAFEVASKFIEDEIDPEELRRIVHSAFDFDIPVVNIHDNMYVLETFHGPTLAFKDFGARFMARIMGHFLKEDEREVNILVATSGDTGSAVAQGFLGVDRIKVTLLYPKGKVSKIQEQQLTTIGQNVTALEVDGTFDDCQRMVKEAFLDADLKQKMTLSSANSINIARLLPQSFYYFYAYSLLEEYPGEIVFCTPSGNFGNLCAGVLAWKMGLPVKRFVAATNANDIVPQYLKTAKFDPRPSIRTLSNAMDVGNPSNFPRILEIYKGSHQEMSQHITGAVYTDEQTTQIIREVYEKYGYLLCPHSAIGYAGLRDTLKSIKGNPVGVFLATASPAKFGDIVEPVIGTTVDIPERLLKIVEREKKAISIGNQPKDLKDFLNG